jgi:hypothetical protein
MRLGTGLVLGKVGDVGAPPIEQFSAFVAGQSLAEYYLIRGTPRVALNLAEDIRTHFGFSDAGTMAAYNTGAFVHDGASESAEDWTVRLDNLAAGGSNLIDVIFPSNIASGNYWWNSQDNTVATGNAEDEIDTPGPLWRALIAAIEARVTAGYPPDAFFWSQGTSDMTTDAGNLALYEAKLEDLFTAVRVAAGKTIPIFIMKLGRHQTANTVGAENIRQIQRNVAANVPRVYFGVEEYPYRYAVAGSHASAGITADSNVVTLANTTGLAVNDWIEGPGIPEGAYVSALSANTSITLSKLVNGVVTPANATASSTSTIYRGDNVHLYPGSDGVQPLDTGGTAHNETDGFYAAAKVLARRVAHIFRTGAVTASLGPYVESFEPVRGKTSMRVNIAHVGGDDYTAGEAAGWRITLDDVAQTISSVSKVSETAIDLILATPLYGTTAQVQYGYGAMNKAYPSQFLFDNASPINLPMQATDALVETVEDPTPGAGPLVIEYLTAAVNATDLTTYTFSTQSLGTAAADRKIVLGISTRGSAQRSISSVTIGGVTATVLATQSFGGSTFNRMALYVADVPTGATGDVVVTFSGSVLRCGVGLWKVTGANSAQLAHDVGAVTGDPSSKTLVVPANGGVIAYSFAADGTAPRTVTWTNATERFDAAVEGNMAHSGADADDLVAGSLAVSADFSADPSLGGGVVCASFGP